MEYETHGAVGSLQHGEIVCAFLLRPADHPSLLAGSERWQWTDKAGLHGEQLLIVGVILLDLNTMNHWFMLTIEVTLIIDYSSCELTPSPFSSKPTWSPPPALWSVSSVRTLTMPHES